MDEKNKNTINVVCTWGEGPDIIVNFEDKPFILYEHPRHFSPPRGDYVHGVVNYGSCDLTQVEARFLGNDLIRASNEVARMEKELEDYENQRKYKNLWNKVIVTREIYDRQIQLLVDKIKRTLPPLDGVYGVPRGGLPIAVELSHKLKIPLVNILKNFSMTDKRILVVDDISDTGKTLTTLMAFWLPLIKNIYTATLFLKPRSIFVPDVHVLNSKDDDWIVFPWELQDESPNRSI